MVYINTYLFVCYELIEETGRYIKMNFGINGTFSALQRGWVSRQKYQILAEL